MTHSSDEDDFKPQLKASGKAKRASTSRKTGRGGVACASCRAKKVSCDLAYPACGTCKAKGDEDSCSFQSLLYYDDPSEIPSAQLKSKLDRLESNILKLRSSSQSSATARPSPKQPTRAVSAPSSFTSNSPRPSAPLRKGSRDLEVASRLLVSALNTGTYISTAIDFASLVSELQDADAQLPAEPVPHLSEPTSLLARPGPEDLQRLMQLMPTHRQATAAIRIFFSRVNPVFHALHQPSFDAQCSVFWQNGATNDGSQLATYLGVCGMGLLAMTEDEATVGSMPSGGGRDLLVRSWMEGALQALSSSGFVKTPTVEGLRAIVLLNMFWASWDSGKHLEAGLSYSTSAISAIWELEMHRDPDELQQRFSPLEAEERRRVFWALFSLDSLARSVLGKSFQPLDVSAVSCRLPSKLPDSAYSTTTGDFNFNYLSSAECPSMLAVLALHSVCLVLAKISKVLSSPRPTATDVTTIHQELDGLLLPPCRPSSSSMRPSSVPAESFISVMSSFARIKLAGGFDALDQTVIDRRHYIEHAHKLLHAVGSAERLGPVASVYTSLAAMTAAISLGFDSLRSSDSSTHEMTTSRLSSLLSTVESSTCPPVVARILLRGSTIVRYLSDGEERRRKPSGFVMPAGSFLGVGQSNSPASSTSYDTASIVDTPFFMPQGSLDFARAEQYLSPLPYNDFNDAFHYSPNLGGDFQPHSHGSSFDCSLEKRDQRQVAPLLKPWLATTSTLVSPIAEFSHAAWSSGASLFA